MKIPGALAALARGLRGSEVGGAAAHAPRGAGLPAAPAPSRMPSANILLLYSGSRLLPAQVVVDQAIRSTLEARMARQVFFHTEYLDLALYDDDDPQLELRARLRRKYAASSIDLIVAVASPSLRFAVHHRADLFSGVPVVFAAVDQAGAAGLPLGGDTTGTWLALDWAGTLEAALRLQPESRRVVVIGGSGPGPDRVWLAAAREQLSPYEARLEIGYMADRTLDEVLREVAALPPRTVLLVGSFLRDATGQHYITRDVVARVAAAASVPVYGVSEGLVGTGIVGGRVVSFEAIGVRTAELAALVLRGERPVPTSEGTSAYVFDWRQLRRWRLDRGRLPAGSTVRFQPSSPWQRARHHIIEGAPVRAPRRLVLAALRLHRTRRRRAEQALAERLNFEALLSELSAAFVAAPAGEVDRQIARALRRIAEMLEVDRATLAELAARGEGVRVVHAWTREGIEPTPESFRARDFPWMERHLGQGHAVSFSRVEQLAEEAATDRLALARLGTRSLVAVPLAVGGSPVGVLAFATLWAERDWPGELIQRLRLLGEILANALARRQAEDEVRRKREELAHVLRVTTLGELTASLAHEVNQPLAAIMANAQAARRLLDAGPPGGGELREALVDIADDAQHASQVISRLRALCRREPAEREELDVNELIADVWGLVRADIQRRRIAVRISPGSRLPAVLGDRVQLRQVILNALVNACDAIEARGDGPRSIAIEARQSAPGQIEIALSDTGIGVKEGDLERIFEPFTSSKPDGLGMGLSISRSIVEAHGGHIAARANREGGLTLCVALPGQGGSGDVEGLGPRLQPTGRDTGPARH